MEPERLVDVEHEPWRDVADLVGHPFDGHRTHRFGLGFGIAVETRLGGGQQALERVTPIDVGGDRAPRPPSPAQPRRRRIGTVVRHDHGGATFARLAGPGRIEVDEPDLAALHQPVPRPSPTAAFQTAASPEFDHSLHAPAYASPSSAERSKRTALCTTAERDWYPWVRAYWSRNSTSSSGKLTLSFTLASYHRYDLVPTTRTCLHGPSGGSSKPFL